MYALIILVFSVAMGTKAFSDWWLGYMTGKGDGTDRANHAPGSLADNPDRSFYLLIYGMTGVALIVTQVV
jgi:ATP-binding cassette subfamily C (CFTR/MRP) protein 12